MKNIDQWLDEYLAIHGDRPYVDTDIDVNEYDIEDIELRPFRPLHEYLQNDREVFTMGSLDQLIGD